MSQINILLVDDETDALEAMQTGLKIEKNYRILTAASCKEALNKIKAEKIDLVVTDLKLKDGSGLDIVQHIQENFSHIAIIIITAHGTVETAIKAIRGGVYDYLQKPIRMAELKRLISRIAENIILRRENERLKMRLGLHRDAVAMIGNSPKFREIIDLIEQVAPAQSTVLITGESGTGKEIAASAIHYSSQRADKPFVKINCGAIPENLIEAELFGYEKGAFTGATSQKKGKIELADQGSLFLDEIGDLPKPMQVKLLRVVQNGELEHLGGTRTIKVDVRIIAATNQDLERLVQDGLFRDDLYYRLNVIAIHMPPLREREEDIAFLAQHFIEKYNRINQKSIEGIDPQVLTLMRRYPWNGNIRELENMIERAVVLARDNILQRPHFPLLGRLDKDSDSSISVTPDMSLQEIEKQAIKRALKFHGYDKNKTALSLQIGLATLYRKLKEYGLDDS